MLRHRFAFVLAVALSSGFGPLAHAARFAAPPSVRQKFDREYLITHMRVAAADRLIEQNDEIAAYLAAQFNTIVLYDIEGALPKSEERIAYETSFARSHHLHILLGKPTEVTPPVSDDEIRERLSLWDRYGHDDVLGVFFVHDDVFFLHTTAERQRHLYALAHAIVPDWAVFGIIGEMGFDASSEEVAQYFDPSAFDHLLVIMYPLNTGYLTGVQLDSANAKLVTLRYFGPEAKVRMRPSFFPFTEPSAEFDLWIRLRPEQEPRWMELGGCGMVDPAVFKACGIDPEVWTGFAFGFGIERIAIGKYGVPDIRMMFENDVRFLEQM